jgi:ribosomal protein S21
MATNIDIQKNNNENSASILRRFTKKVRSAGFLQEVRGNRYFLRASSALRTKRSALVRSKRTEEYKIKEKSGEVMTGK